MKPTIVIISADHDNAKAICQDIENKTFENCTELRNHLKNSLNSDVEDEPIDEPLFLELPDFVKEVNEGTDYYFTNEFISYVYFKN